MKLTIKTLTSLIFKIDIDSEKTVSDLKDKIEKDHGKDYPKSAQKLIYNGKILADETKLSEYDFDEKKFVVLMITRPPPVPKVPAPEKPTVIAKKEEPASKPKGAEDKTKSTTQSSTSSTVSAASNTTASSAVPPTTTSTPNTTTQQVPAVTRNQTSSSAPSDSSGFPSSEPQMASRLAALMQQPQFRQMQELIQQSPHLLSSTIEALAASDPEMYNFISESPDVFASALNHPPLTGSRIQSSRSSTTSGQQQSRSEDQSSRAGAARNPAGRQPPAVDQILVDVTEHDKEAIERLKELGFSEYQALQAYMACDKDEQLAANLLFQMDQ